MINTKTSPSGDKTTKEKLRLSGMDCADCAKSIESSLKTIRGVQDAEVNFSNGTADVRYDTTTVQRDDLLKRISSMGYSAEPAAAPAAGKSANGTLEFA